MLAKRLFWLLPSIIHTVIYKLTRYRMVKIIPTGETVVKTKKYTWTKTWPLKKTSPRIVSKQ